MINLLPPRYKEEIKQEENFKLILILGTLFLLFLISLTLILFSIKVYIQGQVESLKILVDLEEKTFQTPENQSLRQAIILANQNLSKLNSFYQESVDLIGIFEKISQTLPPEIYLTEIIWQKITSRIIISGFSPRREILFELKKNLEEEKNFSEIDFPPANLLKPTDIDFQISFKINQK